MKHMILQFLQIIILFYTNKISSTLLTKVDGKFIKDPELAKYEVVIDFCEAMAGNNTNQYIRGIVGKQLLLKLFIIL